MADAAATDAGFGAATHARIADIQRKHNVRLKVAFRAGRWECTVVRAGAEDDYFGGSRCDLADLFDRKRLTILIYHRDFDTGQRFARRAHARRAGGIVIVRPKRHDRAAGLGHPVHLRKLAAENVDALA